MYRYALLSAAMILAPLPVLAQTAATAPAPAAFTLPALPYLDGWWQVVDWAEVSRRYTTTAAKR